MLPPFLQGIITELIYACAGAFIIFLAMKADDKFNNRQYTTKEYAKIIFIGYVAALGALLLQSRAGVPKLLAPSPLLPNLGISTGNTFMPAPNTTQSIPSASTAFFQPLGNTNSLPFKSGIPTF